MGRPSPYLQQAQNNAYANAAIYATLGAMDDVTFGAPRPGFFPSLSATLNHIYQVDQFYRDALDHGGQGRAVFASAPIANAARLAQLQADSDAHLIRFCQGVTPAQLDTNLPTDRPDGPVLEYTSAILLHLFQHQIHHRGQVHVQMQVAGVAPPQLDEFFLKWERGPLALPYFD